MRSPSIIADTSNRWRARSAPFFIADPVSNTVEDATAPTIDRMLAVHVVCWPIGGGFQTDSENIGAAMMVCCTSSTNVSARPVRELIHPRGGFEGKSPPAGGSFIVSPLLGTVGGRGPT